MSRNDLVNFARTITDPVTPFPCMPMWRAGFTIDDGWFIADAGDVEFDTNDRGEFAQAFADISVEDLAVVFDGDEAAIAAAIAVAVG